MASTGKALALLGGLGVAATLAGGALGGACGWVGGTVLNDAGFELNDPSSFGFVGMIGGGELALFAAFSALTASNNASSSREYTMKQYFFMGLAACVVLGFAVGVVGSSQTLQFNDTLMSNLDQNKRIWTSGGVCATGAAMIYLGAAIVGGLVWGANEVKNKVPRSINA